MTGWTPPQAGGATRARLPAAGLPDRRLPGTAGYVPATYYPPSYPGQPYPGQAYPIGMYPGAPYPAYAWQPVEPRPGAILGASILAYINSGLLILSGSLLLFGAALIHDIDKATRSHTGYGTELALDGLLNLIAGGLLIAGAVSLTNRRTSGRILLSVGGALVLAECIYWLARFSNSDFSGRIVYVLLFGALAVVSLGLSWTPPVSAWLRRTHATAALSRSDYSTDLDRYLEQEVQHQPHRAVDRGQDEREVGQLEAAPGLAGALAGDRPGDAGHQGQDDAEHHDPDEPGPDGHDPDDVRAGGVRAAGDRIVLG